MFAAKIHFIPWILIAVYRMIFFKGSAKSLNKYTTNDLDWLLLYKSYIRNKWNWYYFIQNVLTWKTIMSRINTILIDENNIKIIQTIERKILWTQMHSLSRFYLSECIGKTCFENPFLSCNYTFPLIYYYFVQFSQRKTDLVISSG